LATAEPKFTRCPGCRTVFRVTAEQLALRSGQVRCGHCRAVFDGNAHSISLAPRAAAPADPYDDDSARGPATVTLRSAHALEPAGPDARPALPALAPAPPPREPSFAPPAAAPRPAASVAEAGEDAGDAEDAEDAEDANERAATSARLRERLRGILYGLAIPVLAAGLGLQAALHFRDAIAARWPGTKPALTRVCAPLGCTVEPPRDIAGLAIDASDLQADPAHKGLLILSATLRNRTATVVAYPHLELTLTDAGDQPVVRRALAPGEYAGGTVNLAAGFPPNTELLVKLFIDASATTQAGYRLYLFYP
jgi:predicted Zn finger-like uncharacterized protein